MTDMKSIIIFFLIIIVIMSAIALCVLIDELKWWSQRFNHHEIRLNGIERKLRISLDDDDE